MPLKLESSYLNGFVSQHEYEAIAPQVETAHQLLMSKTGMGNDFLGWVNLPTAYDKEEFARIKAAAKKIQGNSDVFVVIGIGGSYLGARAAIEFLKSEKYNDLRKDTPAIYFAGNSISSTALAELVQICEGKDISINMISKSGTTTEPAIAFRVFRELLEKYGLRHIRFHDLRHTFASLLINQDVPLINVSNFLGHSDLSTTANIYAHLDKASKQASAAVISDILQGENQHAQPEGEPETNTDRQT